MRQHSAVFGVALIVSIGLAGCIFGGGGGKKRARAEQQRRAAATVVAAPASLRAVDLSDAVRPVVLNRPVELAAARNEWASFVLEIADRVPGVTYSLRINPPTLSDTSGAIDPAAFEVYQVMPMSVDVNRAGYARHTGLITAQSELPRALLPMQPSSGTIDLSTLRAATSNGDRAAPANPGDPALLWVDLHVPPQAPAGAFGGSVDVLANGTVVASVPLKVTVYDFALPAERHLQVVGRLNWDDLVRLYPDRFEAIRPRLMNRGEPRYAQAVRTIDELIALAHRHRVGAVVPRLCPTVKWPPNAMPEVDWSDFDSLAAPWLTGQAFPDGTPVGFWPLPAAENLGQYERAAQLQYWTIAATHFDQNDWLDRSPVWIEKVTPGRANDAESVELSAAAAETLAVHNRVRALVPLEAEQLHLAQPGAAPANPPREIDPVTTTRLLAAAPALVFAPPMRLWPDAADRPLHYLRTDMPALVPSVGAGGDERDVRLWAWLAYLRQARLIHWNNALPSLSHPKQPADPNELIWFYPGEWFGLDQPVPTIQLKWLRRAQQDYEYLWLARERGDRDVRINTLLMAQLISKPVEIDVQPGQNPDPAYALMSGTTRQEVWTEAQQLLAEMILLHDPRQPAIDPVRQHALQIQTLRWAEPQERPLLMGRTTDWSVTPPAAEGDNDDGPRLALRFGVDIYNASAVTPNENLIAWTSAPPGWEVAPQPSAVPVLPTYKVQRAVLEGRFHLDKVTPAARQPMELTFTNGFNNRQTALQVVLPVATSDRREGMIKFDGQLAEDWDAADLVQDGRLVKMLNRPGLQKHELQFAEVPSRVYTSWAGANFYVAFDLGGVNPSGVARAQNFVDYQFRRAWGEDLCEILIQPVSNAGVPGPVLHVVCKPNGSSWVERKNPPAAGAPPAAKPWQEVQAGIRYAWQHDGEGWRGEVAIPWQAILDAAEVEARAGDIAPPALLRFNFVQHRTTTGESASWSGPVDFGRDDSLMGILFLRDPEEPGLRNIAGDPSDIRPSTGER